MNCTQATYRKCLETVAPREIAAARAAGAYAATWNSKKPNKTDFELRATVLDLLDKKALTTEQIRVRTNIYKQRAYALLARMEGEGLIKSRRVVIRGQSHSEWRAAQ